MGPILYVIFSHYAGSTHHVERPAETSNQTPQNTGEEVNNCRSQAEGAASSSNPSAQADSANSHTNAAVNHSSGLDGSTANDMEASQSTAAEKCNSNNDAGDLNPPYTRFFAEEESVLQNISGPAEGGAGAPNPSAQANTNTDDTDPNGTVNNSIVL